MINKCLECNKNKIDPFGECPIYTKLKQAYTILTELPNSFLDIDKICVNCTYFSPIPVLAAVTVLVIRNGKFIIGKRKGSHGAGTWAPPGGKIDPGESWFNTAQREVLEETGLMTINHKLLGITNDIFMDDKSNVNKHFVNLIISANTIDNKDPKVIEPDKCECWEWIDANLVVDEKIAGKEPLFISFVNVLKVVDIKNLCGVVS